MDFFTIIVIIIFLFLFRKLLIKIIELIMNSIYFGFIFIKNNIKPIELPKYKWHDNIISFSNFRDESDQAHIKFYATKNWVEIYIKDSSYTQELPPTINYHGESLIIPKWKVTQYKPYELNRKFKILNVIGINKRDYERYWKFNKDKK
jgi:hypothetical protein